MSDNDIKLFSSINAHTDDDQRSAVINRALLSRLIDNNTDILPEVIVLICLLMLFTHYEQT